MIMQMRTRRTSALSRFDSRVNAANLQRGAQRFCPPLPSNMELIVKVVSENG